MTSALEKIPWQPGEQPPPSLEELTQLVNTEFSIVMVFQGLITQDGGQGGIGASALAGDAARIIPQARIINVGELFRHLAAIDHDSNMDTPVIPPTDAELRQSRDNPQQDREIDQRTCELIQTLIETQPQSVILVDAKFLGVLLAKNTYCSLPENTLLMYLGIDAAPEIATVRFLDRENEKRRQREGLEELTFSEALQERIKRVANDRSLYRQAHPHVDIEYARESLLSLCHAVIDNSQNLPKELRQKYLRQTLVEIVEYLTSDQVNLQIPLLQILGLAEAQV